MALLLCAILLEISNLNICNKGRRFYKRFEIKGSLWLVEILRNCGFYVECKVFLCMVFLNKNGLVFKIKKV